MTALFSRDTPHAFQPDLLEAYAQDFLDSGIGQSGGGCLVIRAAEHGCLVASRLEGLHWAPAFYASNAPEVIDPTGAGNAFLGGFSYALQMSIGIGEAAAYGNVAASFALEQIGLPSRELRDSKETWNGSDVQSRLEDYRARS